MVVALELQETEDTLLRSLKEREDSCGHIDSEGADNAKDGR